MAKELKKGDKVTWQSHGSTAVREFGRDRGAQAGGAEEALSYESSAANAPAVATRV
jgi:hypothetical protein